MEQACSSLFPARGRAHQPEIPHSWAVAEWRMKWGGGFSPTPHLAGMGALPSSDVLCCTGEKQEEVSGEGLAKSPPTPPSTTKLLLFHTLFTSADTGRFSVLSWVHFSRGVNDRLSPARRGAGVELTMSALGQPQPHPRGSLSPPAVPGHLQQINSTPCLSKMLIS